MSDKSKPAEVYIMIYEHRHGRDSAVFARRADAEAEILRLMTEYRHELDDRSTDAKLAKLDEMISSRDLSGTWLWYDICGEDFSIETHEVLGVEPRYSEEDDALYGRAKEVFGTSRELGALVYEIKNEEASTLNQSGLDAQIRFLFESGYRDRLAHALHERARDKGEAS